MKSRRRQDSYFQRAMKERLLPVPRVGKRVGIRGFKRPLAGVSEKP